jgi:hypothetical protein
MITRILGLRSLVAVGLAVVFGIAAFAQGSGFAGTWRGKTPAGAPVLMELASTDGKVTGTITIDKQKGKVRANKTAGNTLHFDAGMDGVTNAFTAELKDGGLSVIRISPHGPSAPLVLTRAK